MTLKIVLWTSFLCVFLPHHSPTTHIKIQLLASLRSLLLPCPGLRMCLAACKSSTEEREQSHSAQQVSTDVWKTNLFKMRRKISLLQ